MLLSITASGKAKLPFLSIILTHNTVLFWYNVGEVIKMAVSNIIKSDNMELLEQLQTENQLLLEENKKLNDTVGWMHDTIWRLVRKQQTES
jgi:hypothetical protein